MARTPKAARNNEPATPIEENAPALDTTPAPKRRGRKPKSMATPTQPLATMNSDDAATGSVDADGRIAGPTQVPVRKRPGPKPKRPEAADLSAEVSAVAKPKRGRKPRELVGAPLELAPQTTDGNTAAGSPGADTVASAPPAAQWDRVADVVRFDWAAIERTASQEGPNQVMAKLLVAARAEGANSRWPL
ncbi:MAG: hypothetical protein H7Y62_13155 [Hyphomicrobium sp.]|nr:hypothetical protein [Hyphomicrobium sp.]